MLLRAFQYFNSFYFEQAIIFTLLKQSTIFTLLKQSIIFTLLKLVFIIKYFPILFVKISIMELVEIHYFRLTWIKSELYLHQVGQQAHQLLSQ